MLQDAGIKLSSVASQILGRSGRDMLDALVRGTGVRRSPPSWPGEVVAKLPQLRRALEGRFGPHRTLIVGEILAKLDYLDEMTGRLSEEVDRHIAPFGAEVELLTTVTRVGQRTAECLVAEIGVDMARFGSGSSCLLGGCLLRQPRVGRQVPLRARSQGLQVARSPAGRGRQSRRAL